MLDIKTSVERYDESTCAGNRLASSFAFDDNEVPNKVYSWAWVGMDSIDDVFACRQRAHKIMNRECKELLFSFPRDHVLFKDYVSDIIMAHKHNDPDALSRSLERFVCRENTRKRISYIRVPKYTRSMSRKRKLSQIEEQIQDNELDAILKRAHIE